MSEALVLDIAHKCDEDVSDAINRNMLLVTGGRNMAQVAYMGAASALGAAGGAFVAVHNALSGEPTTDEEVADAMWSLLKPMTVRAIARLRAKETSHD